MPELSRFKGIIVTMHSEIGIKHHKPHFHARYGEHKAVIGIDGEYISGYLPKKQMYFVTAWAMLNEEELRTEWYNALKRLPIKKIEPLK